MILSASEEDLLGISQCVYIRFVTMKGSAVLITGATSLIGSLLIKTLHYANAKLMLDLAIMALVHDIERANKMFEGYYINFIVLLLHPPIHGQQTLLAIFKHLSMSLKYIKLT